MSIFTCRSCAVKDDHIATLKQQIQTLEKLVFPSRPTQDTSLADIEHPEGVDVITDSEDPVQQEANKLLSGDFGHLPHFEEF